MDHHNNNNSVIVVEGGALVEKKEFIWKIENVSVLLDMGRPLDNNGRRELATYNFEVGTTRWETWLEYREGLGIAFPRNRQLLMGIGLRLLSSDDRGINNGDEEADGEDNIQRPPVLAYWHGRILTPPGKDVKASASWKSGLKNWNQPHDPHFSWNTLQSLAELKNSNLVVDDSISISMEVMLCERKNQGQSHNKEEEEFYATTTGLGKDLGLLLDDPEFSDFIIKVPLEDQDYISFKVHKVILAARSPVFKAMFGNPMMIEGSTGEVTIRDTSPEAMKLALEFIYTGGGGFRGISSTMILKELLLLADKYGILPLKEALEAKIPLFLNKENVAELINLCLILDLEKGRKFVAEYLTSF